MGQVEVVILKDGNEFSLGLLDCPQPMLFRWEVVLFVVIPNGQLWEFLDNSWIGFRGVVADEDLIWKPRLFGYALQGLPEHGRPPKSNDDDTNPHIKPCFLRDTKASASQKDDTRSS